jgi:uncharacterized RDD family membrane protein YckC
VRTLPHVTTNAAPQPYRGYAAQETVTGEGVALELPVANLGSRIVSGLIDIALHALLLWGLIVLVTSLTDSASQAVQTTAVVVSIVAVLVGVPATSESLTRGRTLGKTVMGLRVVRDDGGPVTARHALTRALVGWVEIYLLTGTAAVISALGTSRTKRLGDLAAGTYVVSERSRLRLPDPPTMPTELAAWAAHADIGTLDRGLALALRQFLARATALAPAARAQHAQQLLPQVLRVVSPLPPPGHHPETVLRAVAAERFRRDLVRLQRERELRRRLLPRDAPVPH